MGRDATMSKVEDLLLRSKTAVIGVAKHELSNGFRPFSLVIGAMIMIDSH